MTKQNQPLWRVMQLATLDLDVSVGECYAAEIRALRDRLAVEMLQLATCSCCDVMRTKVTDWLTTEADRAERGGGRRDSTAPQLNDADGKATSRSMEVNETN